MGKTAIYIALLATVLSAPPLLAQAPKDIEGWREAKWGMTKGQVLEAFQGEAKQEPPIKTKHGFIDGEVSIKKFTVNDLDTSARFEFNNDTGKLNRIVLEPAGVSRMLFDEWYKATLPLLIEKYGQPTLRNERGANGSVWTFPSTTIEIVNYGQIHTTRIEFRQGGSKNNPL